MTRPQKIHLGIVLAGIACIFAGSMVPYGFALIFVWMILGNIIAFTLKCEKCGSRLATTPWNGSRGWGWGVCAHCQHRQEKQRHPVTPGMEIPPTPPAPAHPPPASPPRGGSAT